MGQIAGRENMTETNSSTWTGSRIVTLANIFRNREDWVDSHYIDTRNEPIVVLNVFERDIEEYVATIFKETKPNIYEICWALGWLPEGKYDVVYSDTHYTCGNCGRVIDIGSDPRFVDGYMLGSGCEMWCEDCIEAHKKDYVDGFIDNTDFPADYINSIDERYLNSLGWTKVFSDISGYSDLSGLDYRIALRKIIDQDIYNKTLTFSANNHDVDIYVKLHGPLGEMMEWLILSEHEEYDLALNAPYLEASVRHTTRQCTYTECRNKLHELIQEMF